MGPSEKQAIATIRETVQAPLLQEWLASEKREPVIKALMDCWWRSEGSPLIAA